MFPRLVTLTLTSIPPASFYLLTSDRQKELTSSVLRQAPDIVAGGGFLRFCKCLRIGIQISLDYKWNLRNLTEEESDQILAEIHQRSAERILDGCLRNGGLYVKFGQGLVSMNHVLPKEYLETLRPLQDKVNPRSLF